MSRTGIVLLFDELTDRLACLHARNVDRAHVADGFLPLGRGAIPHLSLYHLVLLPHKLEAAYALVEEIASGFRADGVGGTLSSIRRFGQAVFWLTARTPEIDRLHHRVVDALSAMRDGDVPIAWEMDADQREMRAAYGFPLVKRCFNPHVTLCVLTSEFAADPANRRRYQTEAARYFDARSIAVGPVGAHGQLLDVWHETSLHAA